MASPNVRPLSLALATGGDPGRVAVIEISSDSDSDCGGGKQGGGNGSSGTCSEPMIDISSSDDEPSSPRRNTKRARVSDLAPPNFLQPLHHHTSPSQPSSLPAMRSSPGEGVHGGGEGGGGDGGDGGVGGDSGEGGVIGGGEGGRGDGGGGGGGDGGDGGVGGDSGKGGVIGGGEGGRGDGGGGGGDGERGCGNSRAGSGSGDVQVSDSNISSEISSSDTTMGRTSSDGELYSPPASVLRALMMTSPSSLLARRSNPSPRCSAASRRPATHPAGFGATAWPYELLDPAVHGKHRGQLSLLRVAEPPPRQPGIQPLAPAPAPVVGTYHGQTGVNLQRLHDLAVEADAGVRTLFPVARGHGDKIIHDMAAPTFSGSAGRLLGMAGAGGASGVAIAGVVLSQLNLLPHI